jgi:alpha-tubulin suppressor-like RCC1 family protein
LGLGPFGNFAGIEFPTLVIRLFDIVQILSLAESSLVLDSQGYVYTFGSNSAGQLGVGSDLKQSLRPIIIPSLSNITQISGIGYTSYALNKNGSVFSYGSNYV